MAVATAYPNPGQGVVVLAHRGLSAAVTGGPHDENSMAAYARAVAAGATALETDVRVTSDGVALAFHDAVLDRVTDSRGTLAALPWEQVRRARIGGAEPVPTLAEVLAAFPRIVVNIDVKSDAGVAPTLAAIDDARAWHRVCLAAFSDRRLARMRARVGPDVVTCLGPAEVARLRLGSRPVPGAARLVALRPSPLRRVAQVPAGIGPVGVVDRRFVEAAHRVGIAVHVWTVNDPARMRALVALGVDGLVTDRVDLAVPLVAELAGRAAP